MVPSETVELIIRKTKKGFVFQFHTTFSNADKIFLDAQDIAPIIQLSLANLKMKKPLRQS